MDSASHLQVSRVLALGLLAIALIATPESGSAQSPFDGTWKLDINTFQQSPPPEPEVLLLQGGIYDCQGCPIQGKADGVDRPVSAGPSFNSVAVKVIDAHTIEITGKKDGKAVFTNQLVVSTDGNTLTRRSRVTNGESPIISTSTLRRASKGPKGSHLISGTWQPGKLESISDNGLVWTFKVNGNELRESSPGGKSYTADLNGPEAPENGDPDITSVLVKTLDSRTLQESDMHDGKVISIMTMAVSSDGKTAKVRFDNKQQNMITELVAIRQ
jgi:hypothetical protein